MLILKKVMRDLLRNKSRSLPILILIIVSQAASVLYIQVGVILDASKIDYFNQVNVGDVWIDTTTPISSTVFNSSIISQWNQSFEIQAVSTRLSFTGSLFVGDKKIPIEIISLSPVVQPSVNRIKTIDGSYFIDFSSINGIYIEQSYLEYYDVQLNDKLTLNINLGLNSKDINVSVLGGAYSPEYPMKKGGQGSGQFELSATFAQYLIMSVFIRTDFLQEALFGGEEVFNQICVLLKDKSDLDSFITSLQQENSPLIEYILDVKKYPSLIEDMNFMIYAVGWGVAFIFLFISMFLTYTMVNRFIQEQRPSIGVLKAIGYSNTYIIRGNLLYGIILGGIGAIVASIFGIIIGTFLTDLTVLSWMSFPKAVIRIAFEQYLALIFITVVCSVLACYVSARNIVRITPQAAIRPMIKERTINTFLIEKVIQRLLRIRLPVVIKYSIRNVFTNPKRSLTTVVSLLMSIALVGGVLTIVAIVFTGGEAYFESENWDVQINLTNPQEFSEVQADILNRITNHNNLLLEPLLIDSAKIKPLDEGLWTKTSFMALIRQPKLKIIEDFQDVNSSILISSDIALQLDLEVGTSYLLQGRNGTIKNVIVQNILPKHFTSSFFIPLNIGNYLSFGNSSSEIVNSILLSDPDLDSTDIEILSSLEYVTAVIQKSDLIQEISSWYEQMSALLFGILVIVLCIAAIIIYGVMTISIAERRDDLMIMKAVGIQNRNIYSWSIIEALIYVLISSIGYFIGYYVSIWYLGILQSLMQAPAGSSELSIIHYIIAFIFGLIASFAGQSMALHHVLKQKVAQATKEKLFA